MTKMNVARLVAIGQPLECGVADKPVPGPRDVLVRVAACGLVPNTANIVDGRTPLIVPELPAIFGLDVSGTIEAVGEQVVDLSEGERVYVDPYLSCETCHFCRQGKAEYCKSAALRGYMTWTPGGQKLLNTYPVGGFSEYVVSPHNKIVRLPDTVDFFIAAHFGYLCTSFAALRRAGMGPGKTVLINGATGTLGVAGAAIALGLGASRVLGIGRNQENLKKLRALAPGRVETSSLTGQDAADWARSQTGGTGVDVIYDCMGFGTDASSTHALIRGIKDGGSLVLASAGVDGDITQSYYEILVYDVRAMGSIWFNSADVDLMCSMIGNGAINLSSMEHRQFTLNQVNDAIRLVRSRPGGFTNVVVTP